MARGVSGGPIQPKTLPKKSNIGTHICTSGCGYGWIVFRNPAKQTFDLESLPGCWTAMVAKWASCVLFTGTRVYCLCREARWAKARTG